MKGCWSNIYIDIETYLPTYLRVGLHTVYIGSLHPMSPGGMKSSAITLHL